MTKKQQISKKTTAKRVTKKTLAKQKGTVDVRRVLVGVVATVIALLAAIVIAYFTIAAIYGNQVNDRYNRITAIYDSLKLEDQSYFMEDAKVFGDKRPYNWDKSRSESSYVVYLHGDTVSNTVKELDENIRSSGFTFIDEPYPETPGSIQYHYKSEKGEYIRLTVQSQPYLQAIQNTILMENKNADEMAAIRANLDPDAGPSLVTLKVNLDDNNE